MSEITLSQTSDTLSQGGNTLSHAVAQDIQPVVTGLPTPSELLDSKNLRPTTRRKYELALERYLASGRSLTSTSDLVTYVRDLTGSQLAMFRPVIRLVLDEVETQSNLSANPANVQYVQALQYQLRGIRNRLQGSKTQTASHGRKLGQWLTPKQVRQLTALAKWSSGDLGQRRDWLVLALLVGAGLRRSELVALTFANVVDVAGEQRTALEVTGKGNKARIIPISSLLATRLREWQEQLEADDDELVVRSYVYRKLGESLTTHAVYKLVERYGAKIGVKALRPHDLRRTYAFCGYKAGVDILQLKETLGHKSVRTTQIYLNMDVDFKNTASDYVPLSDL